MSYSTLAKQHIKFDLDSVVSHYR